MNCCLSRILFYLWSQIKIHQMNNTINQPITSKYSEVVSEVRENTRQGMAHEQAVQSAMDKYWFKFILDDQEILLAWFNNSAVA